MFDRVYYEPASLEYPLGEELKKKYANLPWVEIESHNKIEELQKKENAEFAKMKSYLIIGTRKTHKYTPNEKVSDFLVPYTSSGCTAMCLYCYLVCNYNKCAYLRLFVNREQMMKKLLRHAAKHQESYTYEIGSNSDLVLENTITNNLVWTIEEFAKSERGQLTFPTKFHMVDPLLPLNHRERIIFRMSINPSEIIRKIEFGTSKLDERIEATNKMSQAGYQTGILIAPIIHTQNWMEEYGELFTILGDKLSAKVKKGLFIEMIFMTYSFIHRAINNDAFPNAVELYSKEDMTGRGRGRYTYRPSVRAEMEEFLKAQIQSKLPEAKILYIC